MCRIRLKKTFLKSNGGNKKVQRERDREREKEDVRELREEAEGQKKRKEKEEINWKKNFVREEKS